MKWKYSTEKKKSAESPYLRLPYGKKVVVEIKKFSIEKKPIEDINKTIFQSDVVKVDDEKVEKIWTIFNYENVMELKKKLANKKAPLKFEVTRKRDEDEMEDYYEITVLKKE